MISPIYTDAASLPLGFTESTMASGLSNATAMEFSPDGRLFVCQQDGRLRVIKNGSLLSTPFLTVNVSAEGERGLLGVAFDPDFATNQFVYVYYTAPSPSPHNRVSQFTANGDTGGGETILLELNNLTSGNFHNGGAIHFGADGKLYIASGENNNSANAQTLGNLLGKILRINPDGSIPTDNPFYNTATGTNRAIWALGLRNPFTFAVQPGTGRMFINDVGQGNWEEINDGMAGANFGWPNCEGDCSNPSYINAIFRYAHGSGSTTGNAITGGAFYNPATVQFPASYVGKYFFADYTSGWIRMLDPANGNQASGFASGISSPVDLKTGPDGRLYYLARGNSAVVAIGYTGGAAPQITQQPADQAVLAGQPATFTVASTGTTSHQWQRNSANIPGANSASYTLASSSVSDDGAVFRCLLSNSAGTTTSNGAILHVSSNNPPVGTISAPASGSLYTAGDTIAYSGTASDAEDTTVPAGRFSWTITFHHDTHSHPHLGPINGATSGSFTIPTQGETAANVWYRIALTVTDSGGQTHTSVRDIHPRTAVLALATNPAGLQVTLDGQPVPTPLATTSVVGVSRSLGVVSPQQSGGATYDFVSWSDGGAATHAISSPASDTTYTAGFSVRPPAASAPVITSTLNATGTAGASFNYAIVATQSPTTYGATGLPANLSINPTSGVISGVPAGAGTRAVTLTATNATGTGSAVLNLTINAAPGPGVAGLVAAYDFNQGSGATLADVSGNANHGAINGATWTASGRNGGALDFNGTSNLVVVNSSPSLNFTGAMTIEAWVYPTASQSGWRSIVQREVDAYFLHASSNSPLHPAGGGIFNGSLAFATSTSAIAVNAWTHLAVTYDQTAIRMYVNGTQVASQSRTGAIQSTSSPLRIGGNVPYGEFFRGRIDDIRLYNRALTSAEILSDLNTPVGASGASPTISPIADQNTASNTPVGPIGFTVGDSDTPASSLTLSGASSNLSLVPNGNIAFGGSGANRTLTISPAANQSGTATITVNVSDGINATSDSLVLTVAAAPPPPPPPPVITSTLSATGTTGTNFSYAITAANSPTSYGATGLPANLAVNTTTGVINGTPSAAGNYAVTLTAANAFGAGSAVLDLAIGSAPPANTPPTISSIANQVATANSAVGPLAFTVGDAQTSAGSLTVSGASSNQALVPDSNLTFGGSGVNRTVTVTPASGQSGSSTITLTVSDGTLSTGSSFNLTVNPAPGLGAAGLVAAYDFNQGSSATLADVSGNANHGAINGATWTTNGRNGGALDFNGASNMVVINSSPSLNFTGAMTIEAWVYPLASQSGWRCIVQREVDAYFLHASSNSPMHPAGGGIFNGSLGFATSTPAIAVNAWSHLAVTYDQTSIRVYVNGAQVASQSRTGAIQSTSSPLRIGGNVPYGEFFKGRIDDVRLYNRALTAAEILSDLNTPVGASGTSAPPAPWQSIDIGSVGTAGSASHADGTFTVKGAGAIGGTADSFHFVYQTLSADGEIRGRINSAENTGTAGRIGVMIRESLTSGSNYVFMGIRPDGTFRWQQRIATAGTTSATDLTVGTPPNIWARLVRTGNTLSGYLSTDGVNWTLASSYDFAMATNIYIGLAVASGTAGTLNTAAFSSTSVIP